MNILKALLIILFCLTLSSCATLHMVSFGISALSYSFTGKSVTDHVISEVSSQDCALHRLILGQQPCLDNQQDFYAVLNAPDPQVLTPEAKWRTNDTPTNNTQYFATNQQEKPRNLGLQQGKHRQVALEDIHTFSALDFNLQELESLAQSVPNETLNSADNFYQRLIPVSDIPKLYAVVGTFSQRVYAQTRQHEYQHHQAHLVTNGQRYQVVIGPLNADQYSDFVALDHKEPPWRTRLCQDLTPAPCDAAMLASR